MTSAERFVAALTFGNPDKVPLLPGGPRESTRARWVREGMPAEAGENMGTALHHVICNELGIDMAEPINDTGFFVDFRMKPLSRVMSASAHSSACAPIRKSGTIASRCLFFVLREAARARRHIAPARIAALSGIGE